MNRCPFPWLRGPHEAQTVKGKMACGLVLCEHEKCDQSTESSRKERALIIREVIREYHGGSGLEG